MRPGTPTSASVEAGQHDHASGRARSSCCSRVALTAASRPRPTGCRSRPTFDLHAAADVCDYLAALGVGRGLPARRCCRRARARTTATTSSPSTPSTRSAAASTGGRDLLAAARARGLGVVVDIVPNHTGVADAAENAAWWDVLQHGQDSPYARWFDIDWARGRHAAAGARRRLRPVAELEVVDGRRPELRYFEHRFPIAPGTGRPGDAAPRCTTGSTTSWSTAAAPTPSRTTAASSPSPRWPGCGSRTRRSSTPRTSRSPGGCARTASTACASTTRTAWPTRCGYLDPAARARRRRRVDARSRRSSSRRGAAARLAGRRHHRLRRAGRGHRRVRRPRRPRRRSTRCTASSPATQLDCAEHVAAGKRDGVDDDPAGRGRRGWPGWCPTSTERRERAGRAARRASRSTARYLPDGREHLAAAIDAARAPPARSRPTRSTRSPPRLADPADELCVALPADLRRGDGQGRRGHRVLPLHPLRRAQRGRRRPGHFGVGARGLPRARRRRASDARRAA